ncbi:tetratricopeptide repeat protein [Lysobacter sp. F6437]|uniref:tetratricopeptide repeat protein n=1 Tax=Lysobacter sp. F6437 TaxID=3459296 RepID=UPI00403DE0B1
MNPATSRPGTVRTLIAAAVVIPLAWLTLQLGRVDGDIGAPTGPERLIEAIDDAPALPVAAGGQARAALHDRPIDGRAYRVLAQVAQSNGDQQQAGRLYAIAAERWPRDRIAQAALVDRAFAEGDIDRGLTHLDALLRVAPRLRPALLGGLMPYLGDTEMRAGLVQRLAQDPPWRAAMIAPLLAETTPVEPAQTLLAELAATGPLSERELHARVSLLDRAGRAADARQVWLQTLAVDDRAAAGLVFDGGFEHPGVTGGYGWQYDNPPAGVAIGPDPTDPLSGEYALSIVFDGRAVRFAHLRQPLALAPGRYQLQAAAWQSINTSRPFVWQLSCSVGTGGVLAELPLGAAPVWTSVKTAFDVPPGCERQQLQLRHTARSLAERTIRGSIQLDETFITKLP